jgi:hypothetical protein
VALSWRHDLPGGLAVVRRLNQQTAQGIVVAFGRSADPGDLERIRFEPGSLDADSFQVFYLENFQGAVPGQFFVRIAVRAPIELIPVDFAGGDLQGELIRGAREVAAGVSQGAALILSSDNIGRLRDQQLYVEVKGDLVREERPSPEFPNGRPIDGNFLAGQLPTGDLVPGGTFWSWFTLGQPG